jgi:hypothetical protein
MPCFKLRDPNAIVAQLAARISHRWQPAGVYPHTMHIALEAAVREHLQELGESPKGGLMDMDYDALPRGTRMA